MAASRPEKKSRLRLLRAGTELSLSNCLDKWLHRHGSQLRKYGEHREDKSPFGAPCCAERRAFARPRSSEVVAEKHHVIVGLNYLNLKKVPLRFFDSPRRARPPLVSERINTRSQNLDHRDDTFLVEVFEPCFWIEQDQEVLNQAAVSPFSRHVAAAASNILR